MNPDPQPCADEDCCNLFVPQLPQRVYCYDPACKDRRVERNNKAKMERVKRLKADGKWLGHLHRVKGVGRGNMRHVKPGATIGTRLCLKCDKQFEVPAGTDDRICRDCHLENDELLAEYDDRALGLYPPPPTSSVGRCQPFESDDRFG